MKHSKWMTFENTYTCGYCGFDPAVTENHYCDGFGHSVELATNKVHGERCPDCQHSRFCEKAWDLEHPGEPLPQAN